MKQKVSVFGVGRLGLSFALLLEGKGYDVMGCDINEKYIQSLKGKTFLSKEPFINEFLSSSKVSFTNKHLDAFDHADLLFVFVPTPSKPLGDYDHSCVEELIERIEVNGIRNKTLIIGCTVMPYYCESIERRLAHLDISVIYNPEFIAQGDIVNGLKKSDIVLIGGDNVPVELLQIYNTIMDKEPNFKILSLTGAEIAKIAINTFLDMKIAYANLVGDIIVKSGEAENTNDILQTIGCDSRIGTKYFGYGLPAGGVCIPRDAKALNHHANYVGVHTKFTHAINLENERHFTNLLEYYLEENKDSSVPYVFSYLGYKKGVDILTESYQFKLCMELLKQGKKVSVPLSVKEMDMPEEFNNFAYRDKVLFGDSIEGYKIN